jgi:hypothetical protein
MITREEDIDAHALARQRWRGCVTTGSCARSWRVTSPGPARAPGCPARHRSPSLPAHRRRPPTSRRLTSQNKHSNPKGSRDPKTTVMSW